MANMTEKIENLDFSNQLKNMEKRLTELVDKKTETAIKTTCEKVDKTYAAVESTQETDRKLGKLRKRKASTTSNKVSEYKGSLKIITKQKLKILSPQLTK